MRQLLNTTCYVSPRYTHVVDVEEERMNMLRHATGFSCAGTQHVSDAHLTIVWHAEIRRVNDTFLHDTRQKPTMDLKTFHRCMSARYGLSDANVVAECFRIYSGCGDAGI